MAKFTDEQVSAILSTASKAVGKDGSDLTVTAVDLITIALVIAYRKFDASEGILLQSISSAWEATAHTIPANDTKEPS